jgi:hypothetical protein
VTLGATPQASIAAGIELLGVRVGLGLRLP